MSEVQMNATTELAFLIVKFVKCLQKKSARETSLAGCTKINLQNHLHLVDNEGQYSSKMIKSKNKYQLIQSIIEEEGIIASIDQYAEQLEERGVDTKLIQQVETFGV